MTILKDIKNCFSFLTRFPVSKDIDIYKDLALKIWLFPIVGLVIGLIVSFVSLILFKFLPFLLVGFIILGLLLLMTGAHHTDGLIDFGDGLMAMGTSDHKIKVMHDVAIGAGGFTLGLIILSSTAITISYSMNFIIIALVISEVGAKFGMVAACSIGKSANTKTATTFINSNKKKHMFISLILSLALIYFTIIIIALFNSLYNHISYFKLLFIPINNVSPCNFIQILIYFIIFIVGSFLPLIIVLKLSYKNFNGLTGDCIGALNDITRLFILILIFILETLAIL
ncbi:MAG: adenosylcobinamide-GDP ribazoletransferase [Promethearchaeota archaeon]